MTHQNPGRRRRSASGSHNIVTIRSHTPDTPPCCTKSHSSAAKKLRVTALYVAYGHAAATQLSNNASGRGHTDSTRARGVRVARGYAAPQNGSWVGGGGGGGGEGSRTPLRQKKERQKSLCVSSAFRRRGVGRRGAACEYAPHTYLSLSASCCDLRVAFGGDRGHSCCSCHTSTPPASKPTVR